MAERYKPTSAEKRMDRLLESRDVALEQIHDLMMSRPQKPIGLLGYIDAFERISNLIIRVENAGAGESKEIVIRFERVPELEFEKEDGGDD